MAVAHIKVPHAEITSAFSRPWIDLPFKPDREWAGGEPGHVLGLMLVVLLVPQLLAHCTLNCADLLVTFDDVLA